MRHCGSLPAHNKILVVPLEAETNISGEMELENGGGSSFKQNKAPYIAQFRPRLRQNFYMWSASGSRFDAQQIIPGIWLGSIRAAFDRTELINNNILHALTVANGMVEFVDPNQKDIVNEFSPTTPVPRELSWFESHGAVDINDEQTECILDSLADALSFLDDRINENRGETLVHCAAGVSRSATVVIAYLMIRKQMKMKEALAFVQKARSCVFPNPGFQNQLLVLEKCNGDIEEAKQAYKSGKYGFFSQPTPRYECLFPKIV